MRYVFALCLALAACTGEEATPIDLQRTVTTSVDATTTTEDPNAEVREQAEQLAAEQCLEDPELEKGIIQIVDPDSGEIAGEVIADCAVVRSQQE